MLKLLASYSLERRQCTNFNGTISEVTPVPHGVAQGSVLGPLLFNLYMNDLPDNFKILNIKMYADDTILYCEIDKSKNLENRIKCINEELEILSTWCKVNKVTIYIEKSKCMLFTPSKNRFRIDLQGEFPSLYLDHRKLGFVNTYCYLGLRLDSHLQMNDHIYIICHWKS